MSAWEEAFDEASQRSYFFNRITGETSWTPPGEATSENESSNSNHGWQQAFDEASQTSYYYNIHTGETSWTLPEVEHEEDLSYLVFAVVRLQSLFRGKRERRRAMRLVKAHYQVTKDPVTDQTLYTNLVSNTSSWTKPALFTTLGIGDGEEDDDNDDANFDDFHLEAEQGDGDPDNNDEDDDDAEGSGNKKSRRKYPRSKAQERVDEVEDAGKEGTELDLSELNAWKLSSRIWNLQYLKKLVLSKNQLARIPSGIQDLVHLEELDVSYNHLTRLPSCLQTTITLTALNASRAMRRLDLSHTMLQELPYVEGDLKLLRETREWQEVKKARSEAEKAGSSIVTKKQQQLRPNERFAAEIARIKAELHDKRVSERSAIVDKFEAKKRLLAHTRDFKREIRANLQLEMEEAQQRAVEKELARIAELKRLELEKEFNERLCMKYEDELMRWLVSEEQRLEMDRLRLFEEAQRKADAKAAYATRLARRGGRRQQAASQRGGGTGTGAGASGSSSRAQSRNTASSSSSSSTSAVSTLATRRTPAAPSSPSRE